MRLLATHGSYYDKQMAERAARLWEIDISDILSGKPRSPQVIPLTVQVRITCVLGLGLGLPPRKHCAFCRHFAVCSLAYIVFCQKVEGRYLMLVLESSVWVHAQSRYLAYCLSPVQLVRALRGQQLSIMKHC